MKKILICILLYFCSCGRPPMYNDNVIVIENIISEGLYPDNKHSRCFYYTRSEGSIVLKFRKFSYFCDTCGKFTVGDTIELIKK